MNGRSILFLGFRVSAITIAVMTALSAFGANLGWRFAFAPGDITLKPAGRFTVVSLAGGSATRDALGAPAIPARYANILLPDGAVDVKVSAEGQLVPLASDITPWPVQRPAPKSRRQPPFTAPDPAAYASAEAWPAEVATMEGVHRMQGSTFVSVRVNPVVYVGSERTLYYRPSVSVTVTYTLPAARHSGPNLRSGRVTEMVNALVVNPAVVTDIRPKTAGKGDGIDYLIITSAALADAFQSLADYRATTAGGSYKTYVVTVEDIADGYKGDDIQMKIRNCITDYYENRGTGYVVLGGDDTVVPDRDTYVRAGGVEEEHMPTDLYYSDLTGTWKTEDCDEFGLLEANVDMSPEVIVGRIPVRSADQLSGYIAKVKDFEASLLHTRNSIIMGGPAAWCRYYGKKRPSDDVTADGHCGFRERGSKYYVSDSEMWLRRLYRDGIKPFWDNAEGSALTMKIASDGITSWDKNACGDAVLSGTNLQKWLENGYTHMMFSGHGMPQAWGMEDTSDHYFSDRAASLTSLIPFVYTDACLTAAFDEDGIKGPGTITVDVDTEDEWTYDSEPCLGEAFIRNAVGGALAYMGCSRYGWGEPDCLDEDPEDTDDDGYYIECTAGNTSNGGPSTEYAYKFYNRLYELDAVAANRTVGQAFAMSKADMIARCDVYDCERWIQFGLNYLGDPAIAIYPRGGGSAGSGDANGDGQVTVTDAIAVMDYINNNPPADFMFRAADTNGDGQLTYTDVVNILNTVLSR